MIKFDHVSHRQVDVAVVKIIPKKDFEIDLPFTTVDLVVKHAMHNRSKPSHLGIGSENRSSSL